MHTLTNWLSQLWFPAMPATRLAAIRIATGLFAFWYVAQRYSMLLGVAATEPFYFQPLGGVWWLRQPLSVGAFEAIMVVALAANLAFIAGWRYRISGPLYGVLLLVLLSYRNSWTMIYHSDNAMVLHILILAFTGAADAWSIDAWLQSRRLARKAETAKPLYDWHYGWPVQLICAVTVSGYFLAAIAKLAGDLGWWWTSGESLRGQVAADAIRKALLGANPPELAFFLYDHLWIFALVGVASMLVELGAPLALLDRRLGMFWALNAFAMHWGIFFVMGITFRYQLAGLIFLAFFPAERLAEPIRRLFASVTESEKSTLASPRMGEVR
jgi:hypothetical protein